MTPHKSLASSLLKNVVEQKIENEEVKVYYLNKNKQETQAEFQAINDDGQIKGGLKNFYATELNNMKTFFKITD